MGYAIGVAGKGGTGKTTVAALIIKCLRERGKAPILAVDADPNANLPEAIGFSDEVSVGSVLEDFLRERERLSPGVLKESFLEVKLNDILQEGEGIDLLVMGRPEGPGCYCYPNLLLRRFMEMLWGNYPYIVVDNEAGMEHLSRRTTRRLDLMIVTSDPTIKGIRTAGKIRRLAEELELGIGRVVLVVDRACGELEMELREEIRREGLELAGVVPEDETVLKFDVQRRSLLELPEDSPAYRAVSEIVDRLQIP